MLDQIDPLREQIAAVSTERHKLAEAGQSRAELMARINAHLTEQAEVFAGRLRHHLVYAAKGEPLELLQVRTPPAGGMLDLLPVLAAILGPKVLMKALAAVAEAVPEGLPTADRIAAVQQLDADLFDLNRREELAIREAEDAGVEIIRRGDALPAVV